MTVPSLTVGQTVEVVYINPPTGALSINLVTASNDVALHFNPRYTSSGGYLNLNTLLNGVWQNPIRPFGYPFPGNNVQTRVTVRITVRANYFLITASGARMRILCTPGGPAASSSSGLRVLCRASEPCSNWWTDEYAVQCCPKR